jgi:riboflavin synthase
MFTGIITDVGHIVAVEQKGDLRLRIATVYDTASIDLGASIACSGACLTVVDKGPDWFAVDVSTETLARTAQGAPGQRARASTSSAPCASAMSWAAISSPAMSMASAG